MATQDNLPSFEQVQALRRRNVSAQQGSYLDAASSAPVPTTLRVGESSDSDLLAHLQWQKYVLFAIWVEILAGAGAFALEVYQGELPDTDVFRLFWEPLISKCIVILPFVYGAAWLFGFADLALQLPRWRRSGEWARISLWRYIDILGCLLVAAVILSGADSGMRLLSLIRAARVGDVVSALEGQSREMTQMTEAVVVEETQKSQQLQSQVEQLQVKWRREADTRLRLEETARELREEIDTYKEALFVAAQDMADMEMQQLKALETLAGANLLDAQSIGGLTRMGRGRSTPSKGVSEADPHGTPHADTSSTGEGIPADDDLDRGFAAMDPATLNSSTAGTVVDGRASVNGDAGSVSVGGSPSISGSAPHRSASDTASHSRGSRGAMQSPNAKPTAARIVVHRDGTATHLGR